MTEEEEKLAPNTPIVKERSEYFETPMQLPKPNYAVDAVDYTVSRFPLNFGLKLIGPQPPALVSALITEAGVLTPSAVSEELISVWY